MLHLVLLILLISSTHSFFFTNPPEATVNVGDTLVFDLSLSINPALCPVTLAAGSGWDASWMSSDAAAKTLTFTPTLLAHVESIFVQVQITHTTPCPAQSYAVQLSLIVTKDPPQSTAVAIQDVTTRVGVSFDFMFPDGLFTDHLDTNHLTYELQLMDGSDYPTYLQFDSTNLKLSGNPV